MFNLRCLFSENHHWMQVLGWVSILSGIVFMGGWDIGKLLHNLHQLQQEELALNKAVLIAPPVQLLHVRKVREKAELIDRLWDAALKQQIYLQSVVVSSQQNSADPDSITLDIKFQGQFLQIAYFFEQLFSRPFVSTVNQLEVAAENGLLNCSVQIVMFSMLLDEPMFSFDSANLNPIDHQNALSEYPIKQLTLRGYVRQANQLQAIVVLPTDESALVKVGDKIGKEAVSVLQIQEDRILLSNQQIMGSASNALIRPSSRPPA